MAGLMIWVLTLALCYSMLLVGEQQSWVFTQELFLIVTVGFSNSHLLFLLLIFFYQRVLLNPR